MPRLFLAPKIEVMPTRHFSGPVQRHDRQSHAGIPAQWGGAYNAEGLRVAGFGSVSIRGGYARFVTKGHISTMVAAWGEIFGDWLTRPDVRLRPGPSLEYYPPEFDGTSGEGGYEIWGPWRARAYRL